MYNSKMFKRLLLLVTSVVLLFCFAGCQEKNPETVVTEPVQQEKDLFYFNLDKAIDSGVERQKDRVTGLYTFRFLKDGQIVELQTGRDNIPSQMDNLKAVVLTMDDEGLIKKLQSAQSALGGQFFDNVKVVSVDNASISLDVRSDSFAVAEDVNIYDLTGLTADVGSFGQVQADDIVCCYANDEGVLTQIYVINRRAEHDSKHTCEHCGNAVEWISWDGTQALTSGHFSLSSDIEVETTQVLSNVDVALCLNGYSITSRQRIFELTNNAALSVIDHAGYTGNYYGSMTGGGVSVKDKKADELIGGTIYAGKSTSLNIFGGNIGVNLPADKTRFVNRGGVIYTEGQFNLSGGVVTGADVGYNGGAVYIAENGSFTMSGGILRYGSAYKQDKVSGSGRGGTIYIHKDAKSASITGGKLIAGVVDSYGGGLYTEVSMSISNATLCGDRIDGKELAEYGGVMWVGGNNTVVELNAGTIFENGSSIEGGNIGHRSTAVVNINDGVVIRNGYASRNGGNIASFGTLNLISGEVTGGYSDGGGGNIYGFSNGFTYVNIKGGVVSNGSGTRGGNIFMSGNSSYDQGSVLTITGGEIINGEARTDTGGNVALRANSIANIIGGKIIGGTAAKNGGGLSTYYTTDTQHVTLLNVGGSAYISENVGSDVYIYTDTVINVMADVPFTEDAKIGIVADVTTVALAEGVFKEDLGVFTWTPGDKTLSVEDGKLFAK